MSGDVERITLGTFQRLRQSFFCTIDISQDAKWQLAQAKAGFLHESPPMRDSTPPPRHLLSKNGIKT